MRKLLNLGSGVLVVSLLLGLTSCTEDDESDPAVQHDPAHTTGTTNANGTVTLDLADYDIAVTVNADGAAAEGVAVEVYQGSSLAIVWAAFDGYYSNFQLLNLGSVNGNQSMTINLIEQGIEYYEWNVDPSLFNLLYSDAAFTEHCAQGTLEDLFAQAQTLGDFVFYRVYGDGAALRDGNISVGFDMQSMMYSYDAFEQLAFGFFGFIPQDVFEYCYYTLTLDGTTFTLPTLHIGDIVTQGTAYDYKFILTWGENPRDLDSHLYTPEIEGSSYHVYYGSQGSPGTAPYAWLDVDDVTSFGPEVVTIEDLHSGTYQYSIYEYSGDLTLTESEAVVQVFRGRQLVGTYPIPTTPQAGDHWWWNVGTVDGDTGAFTLVNTVTAEGPVSMAPGVEPMPEKMR